MTPQQLDATITFYEKLQTTTCALRITLPSAGITVAVVGGFIILGGEREVIAPICHVSAVLTVDSLDAALTSLVMQGAQILNAPHDSAAGGRNLVAQHPDGLIVEYYEAPESVAQLTDH
uniref:Glyoxalase n=1 Tax=Pandoraea faecigallinarum TaxID=656179 RepID=A0A0H3WQ10_9BURK